MISKQHKCPICNTKLHITIDYDEDIEFGSQVSLEIYCPKCNDRRIREWDGVQDIVIDLANFIGHH